MRVALVQTPPRSEYDRHWARYPALGLAYVAACLRARGHEVDVLDGRLAGLTSDEIVARANADAYGLVGITCMTVEYPRACELAQRITAAPVVVGGAHVNAVGGAVLEDGFDYACVGEGEATACDLVDALENGGDTTRIPGLVAPGGVFAPRPWPDDYDALPFPAWDLFRAVDTLPVLTHRGCPFHCIFCSHNSGFRPRYRSPENVLGELEHDVARHAPARIRFEDETFGLHLGRTKAILVGIVERGLHRRVTFSAQTRVDRVDAELVRLLRDASFETLELGVETGNEDLLRRIGKGITLAQVERAVALAKANGLRVWCKFILGHPNETHATIRDTVDLIARLNPDQLSVSLMTPFPGTPIHEMALRGEGGYRLLAGGWGDYDKYSSGVLELETVSLAQLKRYQLGCYGALYVRNRRFAELLRLAVSHRAVAWEVARSALTASLRPAPRSPARLGADS